MDRHKQRDLDKENLIDNDVIGYRLRNLTTPFTNHEGRENISEGDAASFKKRGRRNSALQSTASYKRYKRRRFAELLLENPGEIPVEKDSAAFCDDNVIDHGILELEKTVGKRCNTRNCPSLAEKCRSTSMNSISGSSAKNPKKSSVFSEKKVVEVDSRATLLHSDSLSPTKYMYNEKEEYVGSISKRLDLLKSADASNILSVASSIKSKIEVNFCGNAEVVANSCTNSCLQGAVVAVKDVVVNKVVDVCQLKRNSEATAAKKKSGRYQYYIKWVGWPYRTSSWETASQFGEMREVKSQFYDRKRALNVVMERPERCVWECHLHQLRSLARWENSINAILRKEGREILYIYNDVDEECSRKNFTYITRNKYPPELERLLRRVKRSNACKCGQNCGSGAECCPARGRTKFFYTKRGSVKMDFYSNEKSENSEMIIECSDECGCDDSCPTKVVQRGRRYKVAIVRRKRCGWGVVALTNIPPNTFVVEYVGEVLTVEDAASRKDSTYHFELDGSGVTKYVIDAKYYGNEAAFINHSCDPNLDAICVQIERADPSLHRIALFSSRRIARGEELTLNYFCGQQYEKHGNAKKKSDKGRKCFCGAANCMKYWPVRSVNSSSGKLKL
uniref:Histone-lysine N-methyltransferase n=1 Tax=Parascaris univalens TaxID=6257 RepID=A0A915C3R8_PARUN